MKIQPGRDGQKMTYYISFSAFYNGISSLKISKKIQPGQDKNPTRDGFLFIPVWILTSSYVRIRIQLGWDGHWFPKNHF
jgi:hypothetical protein